MIKINLAPRRYVERIYSKIYIAKLAFVFFIFISLLSMISIFKYTRLKTLEIEYAALEQEKKYLDKDIERSKKVEEEINQINNYVSSVEKLSKNRFLYPVFLQDIVNNLPETMWFNGVDTRTRGECLDVNINLNSNSLEDLLWWQAYLKNGSKRYSELKINAINYNGNFYNTQISFKYCYIL